MSVIAAAFALDTKSGRTRFPRFKRIDVGSIKRISLANVLRRIDGFREVVTIGRGSINPDVRAYSSSMSKRSASLFFCSDAGNDSSYLKSSRSFLSFAMDGSRGFPEAREAFNCARFSAIEASRRSKALRYR